jgi:uncharacterized membrane protein HdeD (DUF308 family)
MNHICRLAKIPRWIRRLLGAILSIFGVLLFLTPIPGGIVLSAFGGMLVIEDLKEGANEAMGPKNFFEIGSSQEAMP